MPQFVKFGESRMSHATLGQRRNVAANQAPLIAQKTTHLITY